MLASLVTVTAPDTAAGPEPKLLIAVTCTVKATPLGRPVKVVLLAEPDRVRAYCGWLPLNACTRYWVTGVPVAGAAQLTLTWFAPAVAVRLVGTSGRALPLAAKCACTWAALSAVG